MNKWFPYEVPQNTYSWMKLYACLASTEDRVSKRGPFLNPFSPGLPRSLTLFILWCTLHALIDNRTVNSFFTSHAMTSARSERTMSNLCMQNRQQRMGVTSRAKQRMKPALRPTCSHGSIWCYIKGKIALYTSVIWSEIFYQPVYRSGL